jgi:formylglycine-generating enzyme required for sulfatase activity
MRASSARRAGSDGAPRAPDDAAAARRAGRDALSLALLDARNRTLRWLAAFERAGRALGGEGYPAVPLRMAGQAGWFQERWIACNLQRQRGEAADPVAPRLASIEPRADAWFAGGGSPWTRDDAPAAELVRGYLEATLEATLDLLGACGEDDAALHFYRLALWHEDGLAESFAVAAQWLGVDAAEAGAPCGPAPARVRREPLALPAQRFGLGSPPGGLVPPAERWAHPVDLPDSEIDAQAVDWAQFVEFADDRGYDDPRWWSPEGWAWGVARGRRAPRGVEQLRGGVLLQRAGAVRRAASGQAAVHVSWYEADAWCRWAGRRLPTEPEWECAACSAATRGFVWGDVQEWVAGRARPWPGGEIAPGAGFGPWPPAAQDPRRVLRGASSWSVPRCRHARARRFAAPERDDLFAGFRSCAA